MDEKSRRDFLLGIAALSVPITDGSMWLDQKKQDELSRDLQQSSLHADLTSALGMMPAQPKPVFTILESVNLERGCRYKIEFLSEASNPVFETPHDLIRAYLFVPDHNENQKLPAVLAIHQDGPQSHIGKSEPAGLAGDKSLFYGLELFQRGYVVLCPDRFGHAERRWATPNDIKSIDPERDLDLLNHRLGQLLLSGRNFIGKEAYDLMVATSLLCSLTYVDSSRIGAIGHSAGGNSLVYFMYADSRVKVGVSSCGLFSMVNFFNEKAPKKRIGGLAMPSLALVGDSDDYLAFVAPRSVLLTRGLWEWGRDNSADKAFSEAHVAETRRMETRARERYSKLGACPELKVIYFDEDGGNHAFPARVREQAYQWLQQHLSG
jgi:dienelactone hydrolase